MIPGEVFGAEEPIVVNEHKVAHQMRVVNTGDRPVQIGSHYHLAETNEALRFDRNAARGMHLDIPAGTSLRFEPGADRMVTVVPFGGTRIVAGFRGQVGGALDA
jgi:urease subunit beta